MATDQAERAPKRESRLSLRKQEARTGRLLLSPTVIIVVAVVILPIIWAIVLAFQRIRLINIRRAGIVGNYTLDNFDRVLTSPGFWDSLWTTLLYTVGATVSSIGQSCP